MDPCLYTVHKRTIYKQWVFNTSLSKPYTRGPNTYKKCTPDGIQGQGLF